MHPTRNLLSCNAVRICDSRGQQRRRRGGLSRSSVNLVWLPVFDCAFVRGQGVQDSIGDDGRTLLQVNAAHSSDPHPTKPRLSQNKSKRVI